MKVTVRIAVAVGADQRWNAVGGSWCKKDNAMSFAVEGLDTDNWREAWVTAEVDVPDLTPQEVEGQQEPAGEPAT